MKERIPVLLIEDNPGDADLIRILLSDVRRAEFQLIPVPRLSDALNRLTDKGIRLVLTDLGLPDSSGLETVRKLREAAGGLPIVVITGNDDEETGLAAVREGAQDYLVKGRFSGDFLARVLCFALERHQSRERLRESELESEWRLRTILDAISDNILLQDTDLKILWPNQAACASAGLSREELTGRYCYEALQGESDVCPNCPVKQALRTGRIQMDTRRDRTGRTFYIKGCPVRDSSGKVVGAVEMSEDATERLVLEEQLRQAQKMETIGLLAGGIAHDFNNILSAIIGYTELAQQRKLSGDVLNDYLTHVLKAGHRAKNLVHQILAFSRQAEAKFMPVKIGLIVKEALKMMRATLPMTISIDQTIHTDGWVMGDPTQIHQVIMNLCINAYHAMRENGGNLGVTIAEENMTGIPPVESSGAHLGPYLRVAIADTGIGMDESVRKRLFEPYFTTKSKGEGTGLGLSVVFGIMKSHGGMIRVESEAGKGATFHLYFPKLADPVSDMPLEQQEVIPLGEERILVVDDEVVLTDLMKRLLGSMGYRVTAYNDPMEAIGAFQNNPEDFDLVITDMTMPGMTGEVLAQKLLAVRPRIPVLICTGFSDRINEEKLRSAGIRAVLQKPLDQHGLSLWIRNVLDDGC